MAVYSSLSWVKPSATVALSHVSFQTAWEPDLISTAVQTLFPDVSLALVWRCEGVDVVGQTSVQQRAAPPPPPLPLLFRLYSSLCSPCVQTVPACVYSLHSVSCLLNFCQLEEWDSCVCVSVYHNIALPPEATVHMCVCFFHCVESQQRTAVLSTRFCTDHTGKQIWQKLALASGPHFSHAIWF